MTFYEYLSKAVQDDAQLAAERGRLFLVARRAHRARRMRAGLAGPGEAATDPATVPPGARIAHWAARVRRWFCAPVWIQRE